MKLKRKRTMKEKTETICRAGTGLTGVIVKPLVSDSMILIIQRGLGEQLPP